VLPVSGSAGGGHQGLVNLRDLAGVRLADGGAVPGGLLYRSDAPYPGDADPDEVPVWPPGTVIDLRSAGEEGAEGFRWSDGVRVHQVPLLPEAAVVSSAGAKQRLERNLDGLYRRMLEVVPDRLASLVGIVADAEAPVLVHCTAGKDRTGIAVAVLLLAGGAEPAEVISDYTVTAGNLGALLGRLRALGRRLPVKIDPSSDLLTAPPAAIEMVTGYLTGWPGGPQGWVREHGASAADLTRWRERLSGRMATDRDSIE
jgi:protein tyrosine/serine phosphatase